MGETAFIMEAWPPIRAIIRISLDFINTLGSFEFMKKRDLELQRNNLLLTSMLYNQGAIAHPPG